ncbi:MAG: amino acid ABC transporter substrate-binding protein [Phaeodactylibacter sp.]|nr:amino acid ABC transporter substrate-binding protein [Phaeodactylibacter sp.]
MISARSLLLRSNGNRWLILPILALLFSSCSLFRPADTGEKKDKTRKEKKKTEDKVTKEEDLLLDPVPGKKIYDPETGTLVVVDQTPVESMDTIRWADVPYDSIPPIQSSQSVAEEENLRGTTPELIRRGEFGSQILTAYNVALILPFLSDNFDPKVGAIPENADWALHFYGGAKMAFEKLEKEGIKLNVTVMDSKANPKQVGKLLTSRTALFNAHLIIGPYRKENLEMVADFARRNGKTFVSPHSAASGISENNPDYIQVSPTLESHCKAITRHVRKRFRPDQVILVSRDKPAEKARFSYFQDENFLIEGRRSDSLKFREYLIKEESADFQNIDLAPFLPPGDTAVFILPSWSSETFIYSFLSSLKLARQEDNYVEVYGMPQWMRYERIDYDLYEDLNVHVSSDTYIDPYLQDIQFFRQRFFDRYGVPPQDEAFLGHDVALYFGRMIYKYGTKFQYSFEKDPQQMLHTRFEFERVVQPSARYGRENAPIQRFENEYVNILKFEDYQFQLDN